MPARHGTVTTDGTTTTYTPAADYNGPDSYTYTITDDGTTNGLADPRTDVGSVSFTITEVNDVPTAQNDSAGSTAEDTDLNIPASSLLANDSNGPANETGQARKVVSVSHAWNRDAQRQRHSGQLQRRLRRLSPRRGLQRACLLHLHDGGQRHDQRRARSEEQQRLGQFER